MHAGIWSDFYEDFKNTFNEGRIYTMENVNVKPYKEGAFKCIKSARQIWLSTRTKVEHIKHDDDAIPLLNKVFERINYLNEFNFS